MKLKFDFRYIRLDSVGEEYQFSLVFAGEKNGEFAHLMMTGGSSQEIQSMFQSSGRFSLTEEEIHHLISREHRFETIKGLKEKFISYIL